MESLVDCKRGEFTTVVALDDVHLEEFRVAWPTWARFRPEIRENPLLVIVDEFSQMTTGEGVLSQESLRGVEGWLDCVNEIVGDHPSVTVIRSQSPPNWPQRERMLASFVLTAPKYIETPYFLKLDTDCLAVAACDDWVLTEQMKESGAVLFASPWGYTKPGEFIDRLDTWWEQGKRAGNVSNRPVRRVVNGKAFSRRIISYVYWGQTAWHRRLLRKYFSSRYITGGPLRLPVPSQDTFCWYVAARSGMVWSTGNQKRLGWQHFGGNLRKMRSAATVALN